MIIEAVVDVGSRREWSCVHGGNSYVVAYHHHDDVWSVHHLRDDGERELVNPTKADELLSQFIRTHLRRRGPPSNSSDGPAGT